MTDTQPMSNTPSSFVTPVVEYGDFAFVSGQLPRVDGELAIRGLAGVDLDVERARQAARLCAQACIDRLRDHLTANREVAKVLKLTGFVACTADFHQHPAVVDAASEVLLDAFGSDTGAHARSAIGVAALPHGASMEIELIVALRDSPR